MVNKTYFIEYPLIELQYKPQTMIIIIIIVLNYFSCFWTDWEWNVMSNV